MPKYETSISAKRTTRYRLISRTDRYYVAVFPEPNGRCALWDRDSGATRVYQSREEAAADVNAHEQVLDTSDEFRGVTLDRYEDVKGRSGTGTVAVGAEWPDDTVVLGWLSQPNSVCVYDSIEAAQSIHGHGGKTRLNYDRGGR